jgi:hypothetical protein
MPAGDVLLKVAQMAGGALAKFNAPSYEAHLKARWQELAARYCLATITRVHRIKNEYRTMYCDVETDRGPRDFVLKWATDTILWLGPRELLLVDIDTNRFHIPDVTRLDARSRKELEAIA